MELYESDLNFPEGLQIVIVIAAFQLACLFPGVNVWLVSVAHWDE